MARAGSRLFGWTTMKVMKFYEAEGRLSVRPDNIEDLWTLQRIIFPGDLVRSDSLRKFRSDQSDQGELKEVVITVRVEKTELDKTADRLRVMGRITEGRPLEYIKLNSYHTLNIAPGDTLAITKQQWHDYIRKVLRDAVQGTRRARLGIVVIDDEKALPALLLGYGIEFKGEVYGGLSKRMSQKEFSEAQQKWYLAVLESVRGMDVDTVILAGPGFTKDDIKKFWDEKGLSAKLGKNLVLEAVSNAEQSGVYELVKGERVAQLLHGERIRAEFKLMEEFLSGLESGRSKAGLEKVGEAARDYDAKTILVNDSVLGDQAVQGVLADAERVRIRIEVFSSDDEAGRQLHAFGDIASIG